MQKLNHSKPDYNCIKRTSKPEFNIKVSETVKSIKDTLSRLLAWFVEKYIILRQM